MTESTLQANYDGGGDVMAKFSFNYLNWLMNEKKRAYLSILTVGLELWIFGCCQLGRAEKW